MKRIICLIALILILGSVFGESYVIGEGLNDSTDLTDSGTGNIEIARLRSDISVLNNKIDAQDETISELLKASDVNQYADKFFFEAQQEINKFSANLLVLSFAFYVFILASLFLLKAKRVL